MARWDEKEESWRSLEQRLAEAARAGERWRRWAAAVANEELRGLTLLVGLI